MMKPQSGESVGLAFVSAWSDSMCVGLILSTCEMVTLRLGTAESVPGFTSLESVSATRMLFTQMSLKAIHP